MKQWLLLGGVCCGMLLAQAATASEIVQTSHIIGGHVGYGSYSSCNSCATPVVVSSCNTCAPACGPRCNSFGLGLHGLFSGFRCSAPHAGCTLKPMTCQPAPAPCPKPCAAPCPTPCPTPCAAPCSTCGHGHAVKLNLFGKFFGHRSCSSCASAPVYVSGCASPGCSSGGVIIPAPAGDVKLAPMPLQAPAPAPAPMPK
jgi:hypothetical protein